MAIDGKVNLGDPFSTGTADTPFSLSGVGLLSAAYHGDISLLALSLSGSLEGPSPLPELTLSGVAISGRLGVAAVTLPAPTVSATMLTGEAGTGAAQLPALTLAASLGIGGDADLPALTLAADGVAGLVSSSTSTYLLPGLTLSAQAVSQNLATGDVTLPVATLSADGITGLSAAASLVLRAPSLSATGISGQAPTGDIALPGFTLSAATADGTVSTASIALPGMTLATLAQPQQPQPGTGTGDSTLPGALLSATLLPGGLASGAAILREPLLAATMANSPPMSGDIQFAEFTLAASGLTSGTGAVLVRLPELALSAQAVAGNAGSADITLPLVTLDAHDGVLHVVGTASITLPAFQLSALAQATQLASVQFTGIVVNTRTKAVSEYAGLAPNSIASFQGITLMATADGIVALAGDTDLGVAIDARITSPKTDLGLAGMKRVLTGYVGLRASGDLEMTLIADDHHEFSYQLQPLHLDMEQHNTRTKFGHGVKGVYWQFTVANVDGSDFALDRVELHTASIGNKV